MLNPQGYNYKDEPVNQNPFWEDESPIPDLTASATVNETTGTPSVVVHKSYNPDTNVYNLDFAFRNLKGEQGLRGEKGDKGDTGAKGDTGSQGPKGDKGDTGATGPQGPKGDKGNTGNTGATGAQGPQGPQGPAGEGIPTGGTPGQVLTKYSNTDYAGYWADPNYVPAGSSSDVGKFLKRYGDEPDQVMWDTPSGGGGGTGTATQKSIQITQSFTGKTVGLTGFQIATADELYMLENVVTPIGSTYSNSITVNLKDPITIGNDKYYEIMDNSVVFVNIDTSNATRFSGKAVDFVNATKRSTAVGDLNTYFQINLQLKGSYIVWDGTSATAVLKVPYRAVSVWESEGNYSSTCMCTISELNVSIS